MELKSDAQKGEQENTRKEGIVDIAEIDNLTARRVIRKFDLHIMPWLFGLWFFAALDRANIGIFPGHLSFGKLTCNRQCADRESLPSSWTCRKRLQCLFDRLLRALRPRCPP